jgi:hypothetical protein
MSPLPALYPSSILILGAARKMSKGEASFDATGARLFQLPMTPERVKAALAKLGVGSVPS